MPRLTSARAAARPPPRIKTARTRRESAPKAVHFRVRVSTERLFYRKPNTWGHDNKTVKEA